MTEERIALFCVFFSEKIRKRRNHHLKDKEIKIITHGEVCIENLCEEEQRSFYLSILTQILELHRQERTGVSNGI